MVANICHLPTIIALARAGALEEAWRAFAAGGYERRDDDPAALTVKGRLLKDRARRASGGERRRLFGESSAAYAAAAALRPATYPLINAATLALLAGDGELARALAADVLERLEREPDEPETPWWKAAIEAEALLLLGREGEARSALEAGLAVAPRAWEDHASTLRQFELIHEALGADADWLDALRPPRALGFGAGGAVGDEVELRERAETLIADRQVGFGFGTLAAGADLIAAETLLAAGAELHVVLASDAESFAQAFVEPAGGDWRRRFDAALAAAQSVHHVRPLGAPPDRALLALAGEVARGTARLHAARLLTRAVELDPSPPPSGPSGESPIFSLLALDLGRGDDPAFEARAAAVKALVADAPEPPVPLHLADRLILVGCSGPAEAARLARAAADRLAGEGPLRIAAHHGAVARVRDPFGGEWRPAGGALDIVRAIAESIPPGTIAVSGDFAAVLAARGGEREAAWIGELSAFDGGSPIPLYALERAAGS